MFPLTIKFNTFLLEYIYNLTPAPFKVFLESKHELSALFRRPDHKNYRECLDQVLRNFLDGMEKRYRKK